MNNYTIITNMYYQGTVRHFEMSELRTRNFIIEIKREEVSKEFLDIQYHYRCILRFKDLTGRLVREVVMNESQASILVDNINAFVYDNYTELYCLNGIASTNVAETYEIRLTTCEENEDYSVLFQILCTNSVLGTTFPVVSTVLTLEELDNLLEVMFFIYLIDLVSERKGIYQV